MSVYVAGRNRRTRDAQRRAQAAERLAELGTLTSGLAHEIKNPLSTIVLNAQLLGEEVHDLDLEHEDKDRLQRKLDTLGKEATRLKEILTDFLQFAGSVRLDKQRQDIVQAIEELVDFFHPQCDVAGVTFRVDLPDKPVMLWLDKPLFKQALLNLLINALEAMNEQPTPGPDDAGLELMIRLESDQDEVRIHTIDTGPGMQSSELENIFLPYVSTKVGGSGLGLPTMRRIVEEHGGRMEVHSKPGHGSDFVIHLPRGSVSQESPSS